MRAGSGKHMKFFIPLLAALPLLAQSPAWVAKSNKYAQILLAIQAKYGPESASAQGMPGLDEQVSSFSAEKSARQRADLVAARQQLQSSYDAENDPLVRQDLQILMDATDRQVRSIDATRNTFLPYGDVAGLIFFGEKSLLDDQ